jgi:dTDP-4-amino-4,6-dideoxygalactose transaminase
MNTVWENVDKFEELIAEYAGSKYAVAVDSCTNALFLSLKYCKDFLGYESNSIDIPKKTYISVPMQTIHAGFKVNFKDIKWSGSYQLNPLPIIDSAQRFTKDMYIKNTFYCLSFNFKKILSTGKGGMILTDSKEAYNWFRMMRYDGRPSIFYNDMLKMPVEELGYHMYMSPEQAVTGIQNFYNVNGYNPDSSCSEDYAIDLSKLECFNESNSIR